MPVTSDKPAPYAPANSILEIIQRNRDRGLPAPLSPEVLGRVGIPESLIPRVTQSLQALDLIDEQAIPTKTLEGLRLAPEAEYQQRMSEWLKSAYADVFAIVDPAVDGETKVRDAFRNYSPVGQQPRMVSLFLNLLAAAGMVAEKQAAQAREAARKVPRTAPRIPARLRRSLEVAGVPATGSPTPPHSPATREISERALEYRLVDLMSEAAGKPAVMAAIIEVITFLKTKDVPEPASRNEAGGKEDR